MEKYLEILKKCSLFEGIREEDLTTLLGCLGATVDFYDKKYTAMAEGNRAKYIGIVLSGEVQIVQVDYYGNRSIIAHAEPGEVFGEAFACAEVEVLPVSAIANEPSEIMFIDAGHIMHTCSNSCAFHQQLIFNLMKNLATKNIMFHQKVAITSKRSTREKLLAYLNLYAKKAGSRTFTIPFDRQELADYLEVDRSGLSACISKLREEGVLESERSTFRLFD